MGLVRCGLAVLLGLAPAVSPMPALGATDAPVRIMLVGDSITAGATGEWTWRYRLDRHLDLSGVDADLVGASNGLAPFHGGPQEYVDPDFDRDHAASGGRRWSQLAATADASPAAVAGLAPDVVVVMLGVNDLVFEQASAEDVRDRAVAYVRDVQRLLPDVDVVIGELTPIAWADVEPTNDLLGELPDLLSTDRSRVVVAATSEDYRAEDDTFDYVHPAASGEVKIAAAVSDALAGLGIGAPADRPLPQVPQGPRLAPELEAVWGELAPGRPGVRLTWVPHGSDGEYVWVRSGNGAWERSPSAYSGEQAWISLDPSVEHEILLQPVRGRFAAADDVRSNRVHLLPWQPSTAPAVPTPPPTTPTPPVPTGTASTTPAPTTTPVTSGLPRPVTRVRTTVRDDRRAVVRWRTSPGATTYRLTARRLGTDRWLRLPRSSKQRWVLGPLIPGRYEVRVIAFNRVGRVRGELHRFRVGSAG